MREQFTPSDKLLNHIQVCVVLKNTSGKNVLNSISLYLERDLEPSNERVINTADNFLLHDGVLNLLQFYNFRLLEDFKCIVGASIRIVRDQHDTTETSCT